MDPDCPQLDDADRYASGNRGGNIDNKEGKEVRQYLVNYLSSPAGRVGAQ
jgi:hypothetical protein